MSVEDYKRMQIKQAQRNYNEAYVQRAAYRRQERECHEAKKAATNNLISCQIKKLNFERRIQDIQQAIRKIDEMDSSISKSMELAQKTDEAYSNCIKCSDYASVSFRDTFSLKSVDQDSNLVNAKQKLKDEKNRLEQALADLKKEVQKNEQIIIDMQKRINECAAQAASCSAKMATMSYKIVQISRM